MDYPNGNGDSAPAEAQANGAATPASRMSVEFASVGSAEFRTNFENVSPTQLLAFAAWAEWYAKRMLERQAQQQERSAIAQPRLVVPR